MKGRSSERKDGSEWNDPSGVEKYQRLEEQPRYVDVASGIDELELLSAQSKKSILGQFKFGIDVLTEKQIYLQNKLLSNKFYLYFRWQW